MKKQDLEVVEELLENNHEPIENIRLRIDPYERPCKVNHRELDKNDYQVPVQYAFEIYNRFPEVFNNVQEVFDFEDYFERIKDYAPEREIYVVFESTDNGFQYKSLRIYTMDYNTAIKHREIFEQYYQLND